MSKSLKEQALLLARRKHGKNVYARERRDAKNLDERLAIQERSKARVIRRKEVSELLAAIPEKIRSGLELLEAAEFVIDVNGDAPSIPQLAKAISAHRDYLSLKEEAADIREASSENGWLSLRRFEIVKVSEIIPGFPTQTAVAQGDTWAEVIENLNAKSDELVP